ncbi:Putative transposase [Candidatus Phycorickettsia trachydisci]|uniref:Transposase n=1 Tax=Candidatus Phycorickettsia trachydisci TaxID=2115978 RepID=A0A2P1P8Q2_9RICK|nr:PD-(D/E)XK nuclease family transposase [Candidatus Phycorickettsia trachydisci]AVP87658.1 Putative transposase [Candidatus Phycorickettsia trachydisci]
MMQQTRDMEVDSSQVNRMAVLSETNLASLDGGGAEVILPEIQVSSELMEVDEIYADPTTDVGFKMLLNKDKEILMSIINSLLDFSGENEIVELEISSNENSVDLISSEKGQSGIVTSVDILCTNKGKHQIAIEMQRQKENYFLAREQFYMAKLISNQVKEGESQRYHEAVLETYIIVIGKKNMFTGNTAISDQNLFEIDVKPMIVKTGEIYPNNKMNWRFFELPKFQKSNEYKHINKGSIIKYQWLAFLSDCSNKEVALDRKEIIKKGYEIMKIATWSADKQTLYWKEKDNERAAQQILKESKEEGFAEGFEEGMEKGMEKGMERGKLKGEIKGEISKVKTAIKWNVSKDHVVLELKFLTNPKLMDKLESNLSYIQEHMDDTESVICDELGLCDALGEGDGLT